MQYAPHFASHLTFPYTERELADRGSVIVGIRFDYEIHFLYVLQPLFLLKQPHFQLFLATRAPDIVVALSLYFAVFSGCYSVPERTSVNKHNKMLSNVLNLFVWCDIMVIRKIANCVL